jgi:hypothetical protein
MEKGKEQGLLRFVASCHLPLHPAVYYGSSHSVEGIQVADLIAGVYRRAEEGDRNLQALTETLSGIRAVGVTQRTCKGRTYANKISVF